MNSQFINKKPCKFHVARWLQSVCPGTVRRWIAQVSQWQSHFRAGSKRKLATELVWTWAWRFWKSYIVGNAFPQFASKKIWFFLRAHFAAGILQLLVLFAFDKSQSMLISPLNPFGLHCSTWALAGVFVWQIEFLFIFLWEIIPSVHCWKNLCSKLRLPYRV